jgi:hypothetical protein
MAFINRLIGGQAVGNRRFELQMGRGCAAEMIVLYAWLDEFQTIAV